MSCLLTGHVVVGTKRAPTAPIMATPFAVERMVLYCDRHPGDLTRAVAVACEGGRGTVCATSFHRWDGAQAANSSSLSRAGLKRIHDGAANALHCTCGAHACRSRPSCDWRLPLPRQQQRKPCRAQHNLRGESMPPGQEHRDRAGSVAPPPSCVDRPRSPQLCPLPVTACVRSFWRVSPAT